MGYFPSSLQLPPTPCFYVKLFLYTPQSIILQWGSEIQPILDFEWSKRGWVANGLDFKWHLKILTIYRHFVKNHLKSGQISLECECPYHLKTGPFEIRLKSQDFKCFWISNGQISDPHCISIGHNKSVGKGL